MSSVDLFTNIYIYIIIKTGKEKNKMKR